MHIDTEIDFELDTTEIADEVRQTLVEDVQDWVETAVQNFDFDDVVDTTLQSMDLSDYVDHDDIRYNIEDDITQYVVDNMDIPDHVQDALGYIDVSEYIDTYDIIQQLNNELGWSSDLEMLSKNQDALFESIAELEAEILRLKTPLWVRIVNKIRGWF